MPKLDRVIHSSSLYLIGNLASRAVGFLAIPIYARLLTPAEFGIIELIELCTEVVALTLGLRALGTAITRLYHEASDPERKHAIVSTGIYGTAGLSALIAAGAFLGAAPLGQLVFHNSGYASLLRTAFVAMFFANITEVALTYARIADEARFYLIYSLISLAALFGCNVLLIGAGGAGIWGFVLSKLIVTGIGSIYLIVRTFRRTGARLALALLPGLARFTAPLALSGVAFFAIHFSDRFFLSSTVPLSALGQYGLAYRFAFLISIVVGDSFGKSWNATFYAYAGERGWQAQFAQVAYFLFATLCAAGLGIALFGPAALRIMVPPDFLPPPLLLPLLVFAYAIREFGDFFCNLLLINKRAALVGRIAIGGALLNLLLNWALIASFGLMGAAEATLGTWLAYLALTWTLAEREHHLPISAVRIATLVGITASTMLVAQEMRQTDLAVQIVIDAALFAGWSVLCLWLYFGAADRQVLIGLTSSVLRRATLARPAGNAG